MTGPPGVETLVSDHVDLGEDEATYLQPNHNEESILVEDLQYNEEQPSTNEAEQPLTNEEESSTNEEDQPPTIEEELPPASEGDLSIDFQTGNLQDQEISWVINPSSVTVLCERFFLT